MANIWKPIRSYCSFYWLIFDPFLTLRPWLFLNSFLNLQRLFGDHWSFLNCSYHLLFIDPCFKTATTWLIFDSFDNWTSCWLAIDPIASAPVTVVVIDPGLFITTAFTEWFLSLFTTVASTVLYNHLVSYCSSLIRVVSHLALIGWPLVKFL